MVDIWAAKRGAATQHAFRNAIAGTWSICGYGQYPGDDEAADKPIRSCTWCASKSRPPGEETTGGRYEYGTRWAQRKRWIVDGNPDGRGYYRD